jgi:hypothetical protein
MRNLFLALAGYGFARRAAAPLELIGIPELLNVSSAGAKALLLQNGLYRLRELFDIRRLPTRSFRSVVGAPDGLNDDPVWCWLQLYLRSARLGFASARIGPP